VEGMREQEVKQKLKERGLKWSDFNKWLKGQTVGVYLDGTINYYEWDVSRFIEGEMRWKK
jgi:hypothetical protein